MHAILIFVVSAIAIATVSLFVASIVWVFAPLHAHQLWVRLVQRFGKFILVIASGLVLVSILDPLGSPGSRMQLGAWQAQSRNNMMQIAMTLKLFREDNGRYPERLSELAWPHFDATVTSFILVKNRYAGLPLLEHKDIESFDVPFAVERAAAESAAEQNAAPPPSTAPCPPSPPPSAEQIAAARAFIDAHATYLLEVAPDGESCLLHEPPGLWKGKGKDQIQYALIRPTDQEPLPHDFVKRTSSAEFAHVRANVVKSQ